MIILITGANGFIGTKLIELLSLKSNCKIRVLVRNPSAFRSKTSALIEKFQWNPEKNEIDPKALNGVDVVIHIAGESIASCWWTDEKKKRLVTSRVNGTNLLLSEIKKLDVAPMKFISSSAIGIYGNRGDIILDETSTTGSGFLADLCSEWEGKALKHNIPNMKACVIRTGIVLGKNGGALQKMIIPFRFGLGGKLGNGQQYMSWIHISDLVRIFIALVESDSQGVYNGTAPTPVTNAVFSKTLGIVLHRPSFVTIPAFFLKALLGEMSEILLEGQRVLPKKILDTDFQFEFSELREALEDICYNKER